MKKEITKQDLEKVSGGDMSLHELYLLNEVVKAVIAKLNAYFPDKNPVTREEKYEAVSKFYDEIVSTYSEEERSILNKYKDYLLGNFS